LQQEVIDLVSNSDILQYEKLILIILAVSIVFGAVLLLQNFLTLRDLTREIRYAREESKDHNTEILRDVAGVMKSITTTVTDLTLSISSLNSEISRLAENNSRDHSIIEKRMDALASKVER